MASSEEESKCTVKSDWLVLSTTRQNCMLYRALSQRVDPFKTSNATKFIVMKSTVNFQGGNAKGLCLIQNLIAR